MRNEDKTGVPGGNEFEATLVVCSERPLEIIKEVKGMTTVSGHRLLQADPVLIRDLYFDTEEYALDERRLGLRVRRIDEKRLLTLKGPARLTGWGAMERLEIEGPWSEETVERVLEELSRRDIEITGKGLDIERLDHVDFMAGLGLGIIQERETNRQIRRILPADDDRDDELAELDIDSSIYCYGDQKIRHHEIEIESKSGDGIPVVKTVQEALLDAFGAGLRVWRHDKLVTGRAIEALLEKGVLEGLLDRDNGLRPGAYDILARYLDRDGK